MLHTDELEHTMFSRFCMMQKLKSLFHGGTFSPVATALVALYQDLKIWIPMEVA